MKASTLKKRRYKKLEARRLEAYKLRQLYPPGERRNRELYLRQIQNKREFKEQLRKMKEMLYGS